MSINNKLIPVPFAVNAGDTYKYSIPQTNTTTYPNKATYETGFPAVTMADIAAGGVPPFGQDFNGILNDITTAIRYIQSGNYQTYDSAFATSIGGYDKGSVILGSDGKLYQSTVDANKTNPVGGSGWTGFMEGKYLPLSGGTLTGALIGTDITTKNSLTVGSAKATYGTNGLNFDKDLLVNNVKVLKRGDGGLLSKLSKDDYLDPNTLPGSGFYSSSKTKYPNAPYEYTGIFNLSTSSGGYAQIAMDFLSNAVSVRTQAGGIIRGWVDLITPENINSYQSGLGVNQTWRDVTSSRESGAVYTNTTGKPIFISYVLQTQGGNTRLYVNDILVASNSTGTLLFSTFTAVIPPLSTYKVTGGSLEVATELR